MRRLLLVLLVVAAFASMSFAGSPMTNQGDKALTFVISGLGTFGVSGPAAASFPSGGFVSGTVYGAGGKYFLSKDMALRGVLAFSSTSVTDKVFNGTAYVDDKTSAFAIALMPGLEWHFMNAATVSPYWGIEAQFGYLSSTHTPPAPANEDKVTGTQFGAAAFMGAEWYPWDGVSFMAEYQLGFATTSSKSESGGVSVDGPSVTSFGISSFAVGINLYLGN